MTWPAAPGDATLPDTGGGDLLSGIKVLDLCLALSGPYTSMMLAELGADVIKVEHPAAGDESRAWPPFEAGMSGYFATINRSKRSIAVDLKQPDGRASLEQRLASADVLLTAQRPAALARLGLGEVTARFPRLVHIEIVGHHGDRADEPGHDLTYQATHGTLAPPAMPTVPAADLLGAQQATTAALAALIARGASGVGGRHRMALEDAARLAGRAVHHGLMGPGAPLGGAEPTYGIYATVDGYVALAAVEPHFAARVFEHLGTTATELEAAFSARTTADWEALAARLDLPLTRVHGATTTRKAD